jgi:Na+/H+-dicarboxylate symporter
VTTTVAIIIGLILAYAIKPGTFGSFDTKNASFEAEKAPPVGETFLNMIPVNPIQAMAEGNMLQLIVFSIFIGFGITMLGSKTKGLYNLLEQGNELMMNLAPYGTFGLLATAVGSQGWQAIKAMGLYMIVVVLALFTHSIVTYGG